MVRISGYLRTDMKDTLEQAAEEFETAENDLQRKGLALVFGKLYPEEWQARAAEAEADLEALKNGK